MQQKIRHLAMISVCLVPVLLCASPGLAQDSEFQLNSYTTGEQLFPSIGAFADGGFVVVWESRLFPGGNTESNVVARRFDASLSPLGDDFLVFGAEPTGPRAVVATQPDGGFVVVWSVGSHFDEEIRGQRFLSTGAFAGADFQISEATTSTVDAEGPRIAVDDQGNFTVAWAQAYQGENGVRLKLRRFDSSGTPIGSQAQVYQVPSYFNEFDVASRGDGRSIVAWGDQTAIRFRRYDAAGASASVPTVAPLGGVGRPRVVATDEGYYLLATRLPTLELVGRRVDETGAALGTELLVPDQVGERRLTALAHDGAAGFAFTRQTLFVPADLSSTGVEQGRLSTGGELLSLRQINTYTTREQSRSDVAALDDGTFLVVWDSIFSDSGDPNWSIQARRLTDDLFADGFESGDTSAWTTPLP